MSEIAQHSAEQLKSFIERIERLEEEKNTFSDDIKSVYAEAKSVGFLTGPMRTIIKFRKKCEKERYEEDCIITSYLTALGMK